MKILYLLQDLPYPPSTGINSKAYKLIRHMAARGCECDLLCFASGDARKRASELESRAHGVKVLAVHRPLSGASLLFRKALSLLSGLPASLAEFYSADFLRSFREACAAKKYDVIHYDVINMAQYLESAPDVPSVLSSNDAISLAYQRMIEQTPSPLRKAYLTLAAWLICSYERAVYPKFSAVHVVSEDDAVHLRGVVQGLKPEVIPLAPDNSFLAYPPASSRTGTARVVFAGNLDIPGIANGLFEFLEGHYSGLKDGPVSFELHVLGPNASPGQESVLRSFPGLEYRRWVEDYIGFMAGADIVLILDRSGTGIKTRVLEAMALGKPVVGTSVAFGGIEAKDGIHCFLANTAAETAAALSRLLADRGLREIAGKRAKELVSGKYTTEITGRAWEALYSRLTRPLGPSQ